MNWKYLLAIAGVAGVGAMIALGRETEDDEETETLRESARDYFEVVGDCDAVNFTGSPGQAANFWAETGRPYIEAKIDEAMSVGTSEPRTVTIYILNDLVPNCSWPPAGTAVENPSQHLLWAAVNQAVEGYLGPGDAPGDTGFSPGVDLVDAQFDEQEPAQAAFKDQ